MSLFQIAVCRPRSGRRGQRPVRWLLSLVILLLAGQVQASLIGVTWRGEVWRIDEASGAATLIADDDAVEPGDDGYINDIARDRSGRIWTIDGESGSSNELLYYDTLNDWALEGTGINIGFQNGTTIQYDRILGMAFLGDTLHVSTRRSGNTHLYSVNMATGATSHIGRVATSYYRPGQGLSVLDGPVVHALAASPDEVLHGYVDDLGPIQFNDPLLNGGSVSLNGLAGPSGIPVTDLIQGIAFAPDGTLYGAGDALYRIDYPGHSVPTLIGSGDYLDIRGLVYVPEPGLLLLTGLGLLLLWGRRRTAP